MYGHESECVTTLRMDECPLLRFHVGIYDLWQYAVHHSEVPRPAGVRQ
jgi:hypothetical protein